MSDLKQEEVDFLINMEKEFEDQSTILLFPAPLQWTRKLKSTTTNDTFLLDFYRGSFRIQKYTYNHRYRQTIVIFRFDSYGTHTNPDDEVVSGPHIHIYKEGFGDKFAYPASKINVVESDPMEIVLHKVLLYCKVKLISIEVPML